MYIARGRGPDDQRTRRRTKTFTGEVWADALMPKTAAGDTISSVTFAPAARSYWHRHSGGQVLVVTSGLGWVCVVDGTPEQIGTGDVVWTPPGEVHWHGATPTTMMTHLGISLGPTHWIGEVDDATYAGHDASG